MLPRILGWAVVLGTALIAAVLLWPQGFGLQNQWVAAHIVALRGSAAACALVAAVAFAFFAFPRATRTFGIAMAVVLALFAAGNVAVIAARGVGGSDVAGDAASVDRAELEHPRRGARRLDDRRPRSRRGRRRRRAARDDGAAGRGRGRRDARWRQPDVGAHRRVRRDREGSLDHHPDLARARRCDAFASLILVSSSRRHGHRSARASVVSGSTTTLALGENEAVTIARRPTLDVGAPPFAISILACDTSACALS